MSTADPATRLYHPVELSSKAFWAKTAREREESFAILRAEAALSRQPPVEDPWMPEDIDGYWAIVRHRDIVEVSRRNDVFVSGEGVMFENMPPDMLRGSQSILAMDAPEHDKQRKIISAAFTPKQVARLENQIAASCRNIVDSIAHRGEADAVKDIAAELSIRTICNMIGIDRADHPAIGRAAEIITGWNDPDIQSDRAAALPEIGWYLTKFGRRLAAERRAQPRGDLMSALANTVVDGQVLNDVGLSSFFTLLCVAGTDTTRHTVTHTVKALTDYPQQRAWLAADFDGRIGSAIEEFVRWATPVMTFKRTCIRDYELAGQSIRAGEKVVMFYPSGNWDTTVFTSPDQLDLARDPNPHVGFGGGGTHFCLGNQVAKLQLRALLHELLTRIPDFRAGEPVMLASNFIHGIKSMPITFTPER
ncbi:cytochrome P450 [Nocardia terpenica]|uniref:Cytochrome P450 n=1 Tax=Nocardia terpenica TaxID=455432 RepID=A0A6G9YUY2_9NOCA|nr:cytochrome P450 [Nocardia terpenica]QIS16960.1 cytochrome P450 [Nocardia terpenica]